MTPRASQENLAYSIKRLHEILCQVGILDDAAFMDQFYSSFPYLRERPYQESGSQLVTSLSQIPSSNQPKLNIELAEHPSIVHQQSHST
jgi:hypothetical protein